MLIRKYISRVNTNNVVKNNSQAYIAKITYYNTNRIRVA